MAEMLYQGHGSYRFATDGHKVIYVDPFAGSGYGLSPDLVLVTHEHYDHNNISLLRLRPDTVILRAAQALHEGRYLSFDLGFAKVQATPAFNAHHNPKECVGYLLSFDGLRIYCAGDTSYTPYMSETLSGMSLDYAILPTDGIYNMDAREAARCADIIGAKHAIPVHMLPGKLFSQEVADKFAATNRLILHPGEEIGL